MCLVLVVIPKSPLRLSKLYCRMYRTIEIDKINPMGVKKQTLFCLSTILNVFHRNKMRLCKNTKKPAFNKAMMEVRWQFCLRYKNWDLKD